MFRGSVEPESIASWSDRRESMVFSNRRIDLPGATLAVGLTLFSGRAFAAEQRSADDIIMALKPRVTRGLTTSPADAARAADETRFIDALRNRPTRSLSTEERDKIASIASSKPKIDLEINFEYNSAVIGSKVRSEERRVGKESRVHRYWLGSRKESSIHCGTQRAP